MSRYTSLILVLCLLSGCSQASIRHNEISQGFETENAAYAVADDQIDTLCLKGRQPSDLSRKEYLKVATCREEVLVKTVRPVAQYPDLFDKWITASRKNRLAYSTGQISFDQSQLIARNNLDDYRAAAGDRVRAELNDLAQRERQANMMLGRRMGEIADENYRRNVPIRTNCQTFGSGINCQTYGR